jgi:micrococcal nuclease
MSDYSYDCIVVDVHDGDTIKVDLDLGFDMWIKSLSLRLYGINAPELNTPAGKVSAAFLKKLLPVGTACVVETIKDKQEKYGRILAKITVKTPAGKGLVGIDGGVMKQLSQLTINVNDCLVENKMALPWDGQGAKPV